MAKTKDSQQKKKTHSKRNNLTAKEKDSQQKSFSFAVSLFLFAVRLFFLLWVFFFCREVISFAVTVVGHHQRLTLSRETAKKV